VSSLSEPAAGVAEGDILAGKYRISKVLGVGGMGVVVAAYHLQLEEKVAIKFLLPEALANQEAVSRFAQEARAAVRIKSEHVAGIIDVGVLENGAPYMVMEYLDGCDLSTLLQQKGQLPIEQAVEFVLQACEAIAEAHGLGIIHRDLKPSNLYCIRRADGLLSVKVLDFGISKIEGLRTSKLNMGMTGTHAVFGSPLYMSPEQMASSRNVDARTDIWSLGVILYELLTGKLPFNGQALHEVYSKILTLSPSPLSDHRLDSQQGLQDVIFKCLEKDRNNRYLHVAELAIALSPFGPKRARSSVDRISRVIQASGLSASSTALPPSSESASVPSPGTIAAWGNTAPTKRHARWIPIITGIGLLVLVAAAGLLIYTKRPPNSTLAQPAVTSPTSPFAVVSVAPTVSEGQQIVPVVSPIAPQTPRSVTPDIPPQNSAVASAPSAPLARSAGKRSQPAKPPLASTVPTATQRLQPQAGGVQSAPSAQTMSPTKKWGGRL